MSALNAKGHYAVGTRFAHSRMIVGSPKAGTARPDICTVTRIGRDTVWYRNESGMLLRIGRDKFAESVMHFMVTA